MPAGQDLYIRRNWNLQTLSDLSNSLRTIGQAGGGSVFIQDNPKLNNLAGLGDNLEPFLGAAVVSGSMADYEVKKVQDRARTSLA